MRSCNLLNGEIDNNITKLLTTITSDLANLLLLRRLHLLLFRLTVFCCNSKGILSSALNVYLRTLKSILCYRPFSSIFLSSPSTQTMPFNFKAIIINYKSRSRIADPPRVLLFLNLGQQQQPERYTCRKPVDSLSSCPSSLPHGRYAAKTL